MRKSVSPTYLVLRLSSPSWRWTLINDDLCPHHLLLLPTPPSPIAQPLYLQMPTEHLCLTLYALAFWDPGSGSVSISGSWFGKRTRGSSDFNSHIAESVAAISHIA